MSKEEVTHCDGCHSRVDPDKTMKLPTGPFEEGDSGPRTLRIHDVCETCRAKLGRYITGILAYGTATEVHPDRMPPARDGVMHERGVLETVIMVLASVKGEAVEDMMGKVMRYTHMDEEAA